MPQKIEATLEGVLVGFEQYGYEGFTAADGKVIQPGTTSKVWVSVDVNDAPQAIKCKTDSFNALKSLGFGERVTFEVVYRAKGQAFEMTLKDFARVQPARASNGRPVAAVSG